MADKTADQGGGGGRFAYEGIDRVIHEKARQAFGRRSRPRVRGVEAKGMGCCLMI